MGGLRSSQPSLKAVTNKQIPALIKIKAMPNQPANCESPVHGEKFIAATSSESSEVAINTFEHELHIVESSKKLLVENTGYTEPQGVCA
jgi:hypothetical protein